MNINKYTEKAQQALQTAQELASGLSHSQIDAEHVLLALLRQTDGVVPQVLSKMGVAPQAVDRALADALERRPKARRHHAGGALARGRRAPEPSRSRGQRHAR